MPSEPRQPIDGAVSREQQPGVSLSSTTFFGVDRSTADRSTADRSVLDRVADRSADAARVSLQHFQAILAAAASRHSVCVSVYLQSF